MKTHQRSLVARSSQAVVPFIEAILNWLLLERTRLFGTKLDFEFTLLGRRFVVSQFVTVVAFLAIVTVPPLMFWAIDRNWGWIQPLLPEWSSRIWSPL